MNFVDDTNYGDTEIKPCPFCGGIDTLKLIDSTEEYPEDSYDKSSVMYQIVCDASTESKLAGCGACNGWQLSSDAAISNWNTRN